MVGKKPTIEQIKEYQDYFDIHKNLKQTALHFGICRQSLSNYLTGIKRTKLQAEQFAVRRRKNYRHKIKQQAVEYMGGNCKICGYNKCIKALEFHHLDESKKDFQISGGTLSFKKIEPELLKCIMVCSNCHREIHDGLHPNIGV